jgi:hypothetical protein
MKIGLNELKGLIKEMLSDEMGSKGMHMVSKVKTENYMFFSSLKQMRRQIDLLLQLDRATVEEILQNGHDWADDHVAVAKNNLDQVFDFMMNEVNDCGCDDKM